MSQSVRFQTCPCCGNMAKIVGDDTEGTYSYVPLTDIEIASFRNGIEPEQETIHARLRAIRELRGLSQGDVAKALGMGRTSYVALEMGRSNLPAAELRAFCLLFDVSADFILGVSGEVKANQQFEELVALREELQLLAGRLSRLGRGEKP